MIRNRFDRTVFRQNARAVRRSRILMSAMLALCVSLTACGAAADSGTDDTTQQSAAEETATDENASKVADASDMAEVVDVVEDGMTAIAIDELVDGDYNIVVNSSSSMFSIENAVLSVADGKATAKMTMGGTGYLYVYMGTAEEAAEADASKRIAYEEDAEGVHSFTVPVEALDAGVACAAFSKRKELWYDRTLLFRADSLPDEAFRDGRPGEGQTAAELGIADGSYTAEVTLSGGSGKASVTSPAVLTVADGAVTATIEWSSPNYDYMVVDGEKYLPINTDGNSTFEIPVAGFDAPIDVAADTTAMSQPHEIAYTLTFDSASLAER